MPNPIDVYLRWRGRASRKTYWLFSLPIACIVLINEFYPFPVDEDLNLAVLLVVAVPATMINIKRCHDLNRTGWFSLVLLVPILSIWPLIELGFVKGADGPNTYGESALW